MVVGESHGLHDGVGGQVEYLGQNRIDREKCCLLNIQDRDIFRKQTLRQCRNMLSFKYPIYILHTGFLVSPHVFSLPSHSLPSSFSHSVMLFSMLSFYVAHFLVLSSPHSPSVTHYFSRSLSHTLLYKPPQL